MGCVRPGVPIELAVRLRDELGLVGAVETGTYLGDSAAYLAREFQHVWTIELSEELWRRANERHSSATNLTFVLGASVDKLADTAESAGAPLLYWLDGHWSAGDTAGEGDECPVLAEIEAIDNSREGGNSVMLIDDARLFMAPPGPPHDRSQWPTLMEVTDMLRAVHERFVTVLEDVIIAVPVSARRTVEDYGMAAQWEAPRETCNRRVRLRKHLESLKALLRDGRHSPQGKRPRSSE